MRYDKVRKIFNPFVYGMRKVPPNVITLLGLLITIIASVVIGKGHLRYGGIILIFGVIMDAIDGAVARLRNKITEFGAFFDSTLDRYAEIIIFIGIGFFLKDYYLLILFCVMGAFITSYLRARGEGLEIEIKEGVFTRVERVIILILGLLLGQRYIVYILWVLALGTNFTALQRLYIGYKKLKKIGGK